MSNDKTEVKRHRTNHRVKVGFGEVCPLAPTDRGTLARPSLAISINKQIKEEVANESQ